VLGGVELGGGLGGGEGEGAPPPTEASQHSIRNAQSLNPMHRSSSVIECASGPASGEGLSGPECDSAAVSPLPPMTLPFPAPWVCASFYVP